MQNKLWNKNFTCVFVGMIISAAAGVGLNAALGFLIFNETQSTLLSAVFMAASMVPRFILPLIAGSFIDRRNPLKVLIGNELILSFIFFTTAIIVWQNGFNYIIYMVFSLLISSFGVVSDLSSSSIIPQVMAKENYVKGNSMLNIIYPLCNIAVTPIAVFLFMRFGMPFILAAYGFACIIDVAIESRIKTNFEYKKTADISGKNAAFKEYGKDLKEGFKYFKEDKAVKAVFLLFSCTMFASASLEVLMYPFFNLSSNLGNYNYALVVSVSGAGYLIGGLLHYFIKIPCNKRYKIAVSVYFIFIVLDGLFFFMPFPVMCISRFILGILGMNSANIRISAIQAHVPNILRAKLNALFTIMVSLSSTIGQLTAGALGEILPYWQIQGAFQIVYLIGVLAFVLPPKNKVKELYNY